MTLVTKGKQSRLHENEEEIKGKGIETDGDECETLPCARPWPELAHDQHVSQIDRRPSFPNRFRSESVKDWS